MKNFLILLALFLCVAGIVGTASAAPVELLKNGDFGIASGPESVFGWTHTDDVIITSDSNAFGMTGNYAELGGVADSRLRQTFDATGFGSIDVSFDWAFGIKVDQKLNLDYKFISLVRDVDPTYDFSFTLGKLIDGSETGMSKSGEAGDEVPYAVLFGKYNETVDLDKDIDDYKLVFKLLNENPDSTFARVDNVSVTSAAPVPEPATMLLLGVGLVGIAGVRKRFR